MDRPRQTASSPRSTEGVALALRRLAGRDSTWIGLVALLFWAAAIVSAATTEFGGDPRGLLRLGTTFPHPREVAGAPVFRGDGYDGQYFAALATDPLLLRPETARMLDVPVYRASRAGLPLVAWLLSGGNGSLAVYVYQILSWVVGAAIAWVVARWLENEGRSAWWAAPLIPGAGFLSSFMMSMPDPAALTLAVLAMHRERRGRSGAVPLLLISVLVRDTMLLPAAALSVAAFRDRRLPRAALLLGAPLAAVLGWKAYVIHRLGTTGLDVPGGNFALPLSWLTEKLAMEFDAPEMIALGACGISVGVGFLLLPRIARATPVALAYVGFAAMALSMSRLNYLVIWMGYSRSLLPLAALAVPVAATLPVGPVGWAFIASSLPWALVSALVIPRWFLGLAATLGVVALVLRAVRHPPRAPAS